jgi:hypothetical protein
MSDIELEKTESKEIWVNVAEAAELTGYNFHSIRSVVQRISSQPETEREIKLRKRAYRWELWLPDLMKYVVKPGRGPQPKRKISDEETS